MQSETESHREVQVNTVIGIVVGLITMRLLLPLIDNLDDSTQSVIVVAVMFVLSYARGYFVRRYYNKKS